MAGEEIKIGDDDRKIVGAEEGIEELKKKLADAEAERARLAGENQRLQSEVGKTAGDKHQSDIQIVEAGISRVEQERVALQSQYKAAREAGDLDAEVDATTKLADNATTLRQLKDGLERMKIAPPVAPQTRQAGTGDPAEDLARGMEAEGHRESAEWIRKHPEYARDQSKYRAMIGAHNVATGLHGLKENTPQYFAKVEEILGINAAARHEEHRDEPGAGGAATNGQAGPVSVAAAPVQTRDAAPAAAPPSRSGSSSGTIRLTAAQKEAAKISGISEEEYAKNLTKGKN